MRSLLLVAIAVLFAFSIPWYRSAGPAAGTVFGLPDWVAVALGCYGLAALLNAGAWLLTDVADAPPPGAPASERKPRPRGGG